MMIYLDNAATSWPKPEQVYQTADRVAREFSGNPGRSGHKLSLAAGRYIEETRSLLARLFNAPSSSCIAFTSNATEALNLALKGLLKPGDHVITGSMEHNSVARPLEALKKRGIEYTKVPIDPSAEPWNPSPSFAGAKVPLLGEGGSDEGGSASGGSGGGGSALVQGIRAALRNNTRLLVLNQVSNVTGTENPVAEIAELCKKNEIVFLLDAAQSAGHIPIDVRGLGLDLMAFPGHKGLLGPQGTGGLYIREGLVLEPLKEGGTGSRSEELTQPPAGPGRYESGTLNTPGIAALGEGVRLLLEEGIENVAAREAALTNRLIAGLKEIPGLRLYGPPPGPHRRGVVSLILEALDCGSLAILLDETFDIAVRAGLHCAPDAHRTLGTLASGGTLRISPGCFTTGADIDRCVEALGSIT
jgi:selenocysteine lyase/cysteine desulfurase